MLFCLSSPLTYRITVTDEGVHTIAGEVSPFGTDVHHITWSLFVGMKLKPERFFDGYPSCWIEREWPIGSLPARRRQHFINATPQTDDQHEDAESHVIIAIEHVDALTMQC